LHIGIGIGQELEVVIENNKLNFHEPEQKGGIGLINLEKRLELLYPGEYMLQINNLPDHFRVLLKVKLLC